MNPRAISRWLAKEVAGLTFAQPTVCVYNPLVYARRPHEAYLQHYAKKEPEALLIGMNPGPWGMAQTGVRDHFFITNYCPLVFMEASGRNRTPDKLPAEEREPLFAACDPGSGLAAAESLRGRTPLASSRSRRLSSSTGSPISSRRRGTTGIATTGCLRRITSSGGPSRRSRSGTSASGATPRPAGMGASVTARKDAATRTTRR